MIFINFINRINQENINSYGSKMKIINYRSTDDIDVLFVDYNWIYYNTRYYLFKRGELKCPFECRTYKIGYIGVGKYSSKTNKKSNKNYECWNMMLSRCYNENLREKNPTYANCSVCEEWHNFQNFAKWYDKNYYEIEGQKMQLDKDILVKGNKLYSPKTCVFVPQNINCLFTKHDASRGEYPIGVSKIKTCNMYNCNCNNPLNKESYVGIYSTIEEAFKNYKIRKEIIIKQIADYYKEKIPQILYDAMYEYKVEITD